MKIDHLKLEEITEYKNNAKLHPKWQVQQIANSIEKFGFNDPIAIDRDNTIIEGHGRYLAAQLLKLKTVPVIKLDHLSDSERRAYIIAHNKLTTSTGFDEEMLAKEIKSIIESQSIDFEDFGVDISFIDKIEKSVDISDFMDSTQERKKEQENKPESTIKLCPHCGKQIK